MSKRAARMMSFEQPMRIPVDIPWTRDEWTAMTLGRLVEDPRYHDFLAAWQKDLHKSGRHETYLAILTATEFLSSSTAAELIRHPDFSAALERARDVRVNAPRFVQLLNRAFRLASPREFFPGPVESYEFLVVTDGVADAAQQDERLKRGRRVKEAREGISCLVAALPGVALNEQFLYIHREWPPKDI